MNQLHLDIDSKNFFEIDASDRSANHKGQNEEYVSFLEKFEEKHTTDDCYTPMVIYDVVADYVVKRYGVDRNNFVRPFYPGGDYQAYEYKTTDIVVDNPPFSILSKIVRFYTDTRRPFFIFAPGLTLFNAGVNCEVTFLCCYAPITYENGAKIQTSFITNLEGDGVIARTAPDLAKAIQKANDENSHRTPRCLPKYEYPPEVVSASMMNYMAARGVDYSFKRNECCPITRLDAQKEQGKAIFGSGFLLSEKAAAEKAAAEKAAAEKAAAVRWELSDREIEIIKSLEVVE